MSEHEHDWEYSGSPANDMWEYFCECGAEKQVMTEVEADGVTTTIRVYEPRLDE